MSLFSVLITETVFCWIILFYFYSCALCSSIEKKRERRQLSLEQQNQKHLLQLSTGFWPYILYYSPHFILTLLLKLKLRLVLALNGRVFSCFPCFTLLDSGFGVEKVDSFIGNLVISSTASSQFSGFFGFWVFESWDWLLLFLDFGLLFEQ
uniref:Uncharacterized protein n=1 Tax=Salix viminalis TaxID=40686 RepID=A0A6N2M8J8_SALVM